MEADKRKQKGSDWPGADHSRIDGFSTDVRGVDFASNGVDVVMVTVATDAPATAVIMLVTDTPNWMCLRAGDDMAECRRRREGPQRDDDHCLAGRSVDILKVTE